MPRATWLSTVLCAVTLSMTPLSSAQMATARSNELLGPGDLDSLHAPPPDHQIAYAEQSPLQFGRLRLPPKPDREAADARLPVVVLIHGGCWLSPYDIEHTGALEVAFAEDGFAVWSLEYRRLGDPGGGWPGTFLDVARGADHLRELAERFPLDLGRVIAAGHSAGGQLALWLAARARLHESSPIYLADPLAIAGVLALAPAADLEALAREGTCARAAERLLGGGPEVVPERYAATSPMQLRPEGLAQVVLIGDLDTTWAPSSFAYHAGAPATSEVLLRELEGAGHFELIAPTTSAGREVRAELALLLQRIDAVR